MGFEELKKWKQEKAKQAALSNPNKKNNTQTTPYANSTISQPAHFPPCGLGVNPRPRPIRRTSGRTTTPITLLLATQISEAENKSKVVVATSMVFRPMSTDANAALHPGCQQHMKTHGG